MKDDMQQQQRSLLRPSYFSSSNAEDHRRWSDDKRQLVDRMDRQQSKVEGYITTILSEQGKVDCWEEEYRLKAEKQWASDTDARAKAVSALLKLKSVLAKLMRKVSELQSIVRMVDNECKDPYDNNDMKGCYKNLTDRFQNVEPLSIAITIMTGMRDAQREKEAIGDYLRRQEEFLMSLKQLDIESVSVVDLVALIAVSNMTTEYRGSS